jgi:hypothetical protein
VRAPIDRFVLAQLEARDLRPVGRAAKRTLVRRVFLDVLGLPPTPAELQSFLNDTSPDAWPRLVDRLLASPHYGERWGRHWLDVARYADDQLKAANCRTPGGIATGLSARSTKTCRTTSSSCSSWPAI